MIKTFGSLPSNRRFLDYDHTVRVKTYNILRLIFLLDVLRGPSVVND